MFCFNLCCSCFFSRNPHAESEALDNLQYKNFKKSLPREFDKFIMGNRPARGLMTPEQLLEVDAITVLNAQLEAN